MSFNRSPSPRPPAITPYQARDAGEGGGGRTTVRQFSVQRREKSGPSKRSRRTSLASSSHSLRRGLTSVRDDMLPALAPLRRAYMRINATNPNHSPYMRRSHDGTQRPPNERTTGKVRWALNAEPASSARRPPTSRVTGEINVPSPTIVQYRDIAIWNATIYRLARWATIWTLVYLWLAIAKAISHCPGRLKLFDVAKMRGAHTHMAASSSFSCLSVAGSGETWRAN